MKYNFRKIEKKWQEKWLKDTTYEPDLSGAKKPFYNLMMFPYPSGEGLHVGHAFAFSGADIYGRKKRMEGYDVFEPIGYDSFGIHSENYAIKVGEHPKILTEKTTRRYEEQLKNLGIGYAWDEALRTSDPEYYRWTQWIFIKMFEAGLVYRKVASVNWCPKCLTVLADEQVVTGECERCGATVIKKELEQWFFRITKYADRLLNGLNHIDWSEKIKTAQRNWIGKSEGAVIHFRLAKTSGVHWTSDVQISVFTTRPDTLFGATYLVLSPEHELLTNNELHITNYTEVQSYVKQAQAKSEEERRESKEKTGVELKGVYAINPASGEEIPIWIADYVLSSYGTGAIMAVPAHDDRDFEFAQKFQCKILPVIMSKDQDVTLLRRGETIQRKMPPKGDPDYDGFLAGISESLILAPTFGSGILIHSGKFDGMDSEKAKWEITKMVGGERQTQYRLRDWLISRQRYWGPPIPLIFCESCKKLAENQKSKIKNQKLTRGELENPGWHAVLEKDLPVLLPDVEEFRPTGTDKSPLANFPQFYETTCPQCGGEAQRETDVSDTFLDSAWYYLGYLTLENKKLNIKNQKFISNQSLVQKWLPVDMYIGGAEHAVLHLLYVRFISMALHDLGVVDFAKDGEPIEHFRAHGLLIKDGAKMSKSRGNVVNPDEYITVYGADAFRTYLMFLGPFEEGGDFRDTGIRGVVRFLHRVWQLSEKVSANTTESEPVVRALHHAIKKVSGDIDLLSYNTAISALMICLNSFEEHAEAVDTESYISFIKLLAPFAPHMTEELWEMSGGKGSIHRSRWPEPNPRYLSEKTFELVIQVNGKVRDTMQVPIDISEKDATLRALASGKIQSYLKNTRPKKIIFVPRRLINIVL